MKLSTITALLISGMLLSGCAVKNKREFVDANKSRQYGYSVDKSKILYEYAHLPVVLMTLTPSLNAVQMITNG